MTFRLPSRFRMVYFLYDEVDGESTQAIQNLVNCAFPNIHSIEPWIPSFATQEQVGLWKSNLKPFLMPNALLIGIGRAGLAAAYIQEQFSELHLSALAINAPTEDRDFTVQREHANRVVLYSKDYAPIKGLTENWSRFSSISFDVSWLRHGILSESGANLCKHSLVSVIITYMRYAKELEFREMSLPFIRTEEYGTA